MHIFFIFILSLFISKAFAEENETWSFSLFDLDVDLHSQERKTDITVNEKQKHYLISQCLHLRGIGAISPKEWVVWVNGERFTPNHISLQHVKIKTVTPDAVTFIWSAPNKTHHFQLKVNESYHAPSSQIIKGNCLVKN